MPSANTTREMIARDVLAVQRAQAAELPNDILVAECLRRGWVAERDGMSTYDNSPLIRYHYKITGHVSVPIEVALGEWPPMAGEGRDG